MCMKLEEMAGDPSSSSEDTTTPVKVLPFSSTLSWKGQTDRSSIPTSITPVQVKLLSLSAVGWPQSAACNPLLSELLLNMSKQVFPVQALGYTTKVTQTYHLVPATVERETWSLFSKELAAQP